MMSESNKQQAVNKLTEIVANFTAMISLPECLMTWWIN